MAVKRAVVKAYAERYSAGEVQTFLDAALAAHAANLPRVEVTGANFKEGGSSGQFVEGAPADLIELFQEVKEYQANADGDGLHGNRQMNHGDFRYRAIGW